MLKTIFSIVLYCYLLQFDLILGDDHEYIHIKLHLPELSKKHTHFKTVFKHHYQPKKKSKVQSLVNTIEPDGSYSVLSNAYSLPSNIFTSFNVLDSWMPHQTKEVGDIKAVVKPRLRLPATNINWADIETYPKYQPPKKSHFSKYQQYKIADPDYDYSNADKFEQNPKNYEDDEDEYTMTEDSSREQPIAVQMQFKDTDYTIPKRYSAFWSRPDPSDLQSDIEQWPPSAISTDQLGTQDLTDFDTMSQFKSLKNTDNMTPKVRYEHGTRGRMKSQNAKMKTKKRKRMENF